MWWRICKWNFQTVPTFKKNWIRPDIYWGRHSIGSIGDTQPNYRTAVLHPFRWSLFCTTWVKSYSHSMEFFTSAFSFSSPTQPNTMTLWSWHHWKETWMKSGWVLAFFVSEMHVWKKSTEQGGDFIMDCCHQKRIRVCWSFCCHCPGLPLLVNNTLFLWVEHMLRPCAHCSEREMGDIMRRCAQWWTRGQGSYRAAREQHMELAEDATWLTTHLASFMIS